MTAAERALTEVRRLCQLTIDASCRVQAIDQARDTLAVIDAALKRDSTQRSAYPTALEARYSLRDRALADAKERAIRETVRAYSSPVCGDGRHAPDGCQDDGSTCLCACHDADDETAGGEQ
ncbi:hypothetical protein [Streptomyces sp. ME19-01-6]|uniref:hypothetical protein n=1 Tax=Streptomyces sp. ME19-01-6 TaxID=3028686 RepID=UPI0029A014B4|nr:hypothetical protein [Streptomyces sp. ME19-01-6]MDX3232928.1 hypothetical protein [Streptomyces sp. ME19-01-6]